MLVLTVTVFDVHCSSFALCSWCFRVECFLTCSFFLGPFGLDEVSRCCACGLFRTLGSKIGSQVVQ